MKSSVITDSVACMEIQEFWVNMLRVIVLSSVIGRRVMKVNALHGIGVKLMVADF